MTQRTISGIYSIPQFSESRRTPKWLKKARRSGPVKVRVVRDRRVSAALELLTEPWL